VVEWATIFMRPSQTLHIVERFTRTGPDAMEYRITVEDPTTFEKPWTAVIPITRLGDETQIRGTIVKMEWINPHTWLHLDVKRPDGKTERWMIEGGPPNALYRRGFTKNSLPQGAELVVEGFRAKDGSLKGNGRELTFADGRRLFVGSSGTGAPNDGKEPQGSRQ
jgi:hypothetical protein